MTEVSIRGEIRNAAQQSWLAADSVQCMLGTQSLPTLLITSGSWVNVGHELIAASLLIMAGGGNGKPLDYGEPSAGRALALSGGGVSARGAVF